MRWSRVALLGLVVPLAALLQGCQTATTTQVAAKTTEASATTTTTTTVTATTTTTRTTTAAESTPATTTTTRTTTAAAATTTTVTTGESVAVVAAEFARWRESNRPFARTRLRIDPAGNAFLQAYDQLGGNTAYGEQASPKVAYWAQAGPKVTFLVPNSQSEQPGIDYGGLTREFAVLAAKGILRAGVLNDRVPDSPYALLTGPFFNPMEGEFAPAPFPNTTEQAHLRFYGALLAGTFLLDEYADRNLLPFQLGVHVHKALAEGEVSIPEADAADGVLPVCAAVEELLGVPRKSDASALGPYAFFDDELLWDGFAPEWGDFASGPHQPTDVVRFGDAGEYLAAACMRYYLAWASRMVQVLEGWGTVLGSRVQGLLTRAGPAMLQLQLEAPLRPIAAADIAAAVIIEGASNLRGSETTARQRVKDALDYVENNGDELQGLVSLDRWKDSGAARLRDILEYWTGSPHLTPGLQLKVEVKAPWRESVASCDYNNLRAHTCSDTIDVPMSCFELGTQASKLGKAMFVASMEIGFGDL